MASRFDINGAYIQRAGGTLYVYATPSGAGTWGVSEVKVGGATTVAGKVIFQRTAPGGPTAGNPWFLQYTSLTGNFDSSWGTNPANDRWIVGGNVYAFGQPDRTTDPKEYRVTIIQKGVIPPGGGQGKVRGMSWLDGNRNGLQDAGEAALVNVGVALCRASDGAPLAVTTTDANGHYQFDDLPDDDYFLVFGPPSGPDQLVLTTADAGDDALDSDPDQLSGQTAHFTLAGNVIVTLDAGFMLNLPPVAMSDSVSTPFQTPVNITVLANDSDPDPDDGVALVGVSVPLFGTAIIDYADPGDASDATVLYTPAPGFSGWDTFGYQISDGHGATATAFITVYVAANSPPTAGADVASTQTGVSIDIPVLANDSDPDGDPWPSSESVRPRAASP